MRVAGQRRAAKTSCASAPTSVARQTRQASASSAQSIASVGSTPRVSIHGRRRSLADAAAAEAARAYLDQRLPCACVIAEREQQEE